MREIKILIRVDDKKEKFGYILERNLNQPLSEKLELIGALEVIKKSEIGSLKGIYEEAIEKVEKK